MQEKDFKAALESHTLRGCYLFAGEEDYLKRYYLSKLREAVVTDEAFAAFNHILFDGQDTSLAALLDAVKAPPMFTEQKLIEWRYPSFLKMKESDLRTLEEILDALPEYDYTVIGIIVADGEVDLGTDKRPGKFAKRFKDRINILSFAKSNETQLLSWLKRHFDRERIEVTRESLEALLFRSGKSMDILASEVVKLSSYLKANGMTSLTPEVVREVASSTPEADTFALSNAILDRNKKAAFDALSDMKRQRSEPTVIVGMMAKTYSELLAVTMLKEDGLDQAKIETALGIHPFKVKSYLKAARLFKPGAPRAILDELSRVDVGMKFGGVLGYTAIEMFIAKCL